MPTAESVESDVQKKAMSGEKVLLKLRIRRDGVNLFLDLKSDINFLALKIPRAQTLVVGGVECWQVPNMQWPDTSDLNFSIVSNRSTEGLFYDGQYLNLTPLFAKELKDGVTIACKDAAQSVGGLKNIGIAFKRAAIFVYDAHLKPVEVRAELTVRELV